MILKLIKMFFFFILIAKKYERLSVINESQPTLKTKPVGVDGKKFDE